MSRADAVLRRLRLLALTAPSLEAALPEVFAALSEVVGASFMGMFWHDAGYRVTDLMTRDLIPTRLVHDFYVDFLPHEAKWRMTGFHPRDLYRFERAFQATRSQGFDRRAFRRSEFHARVLRHIDFGLAAGLNFRHADGSPLGGIAMGRELDARDFGARELAVLAQVQPWLQHTARRRGGPELHKEPMLPRSSSALLLGEGGRTISCSDAALQHVHEMQGHGYRLGRVHVPSDDLPGDPVRLIHRQVVEALRGRSGTPPRLVVDNQWGRFVVRGYALHGERGHMVMVQIDKYAPLSVLVFSSPEFLRLTDRERQVALGILEGQSIRTMGEALCVRDSTVIYFMRQIYARLGVRDQAALRALLIRSLDPEAAPAAQEHAGPAPH